MLLLFLMFDGFLMIVVLVCEQLRHDLLRQLHLLASGQSCGPPAFLRFAFRPRLVSKFPARPERKDIRPGFYSSFFQRARERQSLSSVLTTVTGMSSQCCSTYWEPDPNTALMK